MAISYSGIGERKRSNRLVARIDPEDDCGRLTEKTDEAPCLPAGEVLDMAIRIERQGIRFYEACACSKLQPDVLDVFQRLIEQENLHVEIFSRMKTGLDDYALPETYSGEMRSYVDSFVQDQVFYQPAEASRKVRHHRSFQGHRVRYRLRATLNTVLLSHQGSDS